jgi:retron-type reverse transcriptase
MEKSDSPEVAVKQANKVATAAAESVERRGGAKENAGLQNTVRTLSREAVSRAQTRIREAVTRNSKDKLTALLHHIDIGALRASFFGLKKSAAPGVDDVTWADYVESIEANLADLHHRVHTGAYRALPSRRKYIPKADGRQRPLGIVALEDKIVQSAVVAILTPVYEAEFLGFSYGFRPGRNQHQALDALAFGIGKRRINWVLDCDVQSFFDKVSQEWLIRFVEHRIGDRRIIRLIRKWLTAGVLEDGLLIVTEEGTPQGAVISPLLANIYLHYVYDLWARQWRQRCAIGDVIVVRYADDSIERARPVWDELRRWLDAKRGHAPPQMLIGKAMTYLDNQWPQLTRALDDGRLEVDNNRCENALRPFVLGRKAWLFSDTPAGAEASARLYGLIETAKANGCEPYAYLRRVFTDLPKATTLAEIEALLPWNVARPATLSVAA